MSQFRRLSYSLSGGIIATALAYFFLHWGGALASVIGERLAWPGQAAEALLNLSRFLLSGKDNYPQLIEAWEVFNVGFYTVGIYAFTWLYTLVREDHGSGNPPKDAV